MKKPRTKKTVAPTIKVPPIKEAALAYALTRQTTFGHDRSKTVGASEVGRCIRAVAARKSGAWKPDPGFVSTNGFAVRGNVMEDAWSAPFLTHFVESVGGKLLYAGQANQVTLKGDKSPLSVTPDGLAVGIPRDFLAEWGVPDIETPELVLEIKSLDDRVDKAKMPKPEHRIQTLAQLGMIRRATEHKPLWGAVIYTDTSDYFDVQMFPVKYDEDAFQGILKRAKRPLTVADPNQLPPEGKMDGGRECRTCEFAQQCLGFLPWLAKGDTAIKDKKLASKIKMIGGQLVATDEQIDALRRLKAEAEMHMYEALSKAKTRFAKIGGLTVVAKETKPQNRYDTKAMAARLKELGDDPEKYKSPTKPGASLVVERQ